MTANQNNKHEKLYLFTIRQQQGNITKKQIAQTDQMNIT